jgi:hypothetical protein
MDPGILQSDLLSWADASCSDETHHQSSQQTGRQFGIDRIVHRPCVASIKQMSFPAIFDGFF